MRRTLTMVWALVVIAALAAAAVGSARAGSAVDAPRAQLTGFACRLAIDPGMRAIGATAVMRPLAGTRRMAVRFDLISRAPNASTTEVRAGDLGRYRLPANSTLGQLPGDVWRLHKVIVPLAAPAVYHLRAAFRWTGAGGRVLGSATRLSPGCRQRELRPDLVVRSIAVAAVTGHPRQSLYTADIANTGNSAAGPFSVLFAPADSSAAQTEMVSLLAAHDHRSLSFSGPLCTSASAPTITADSALQVLDLKRSDNALTASCPAPLGG